MAQPHPVFAGKPREPSDRRVQQSGVGWEADRLGLHGGVDRDPLEVLRAQRPTVMGDPQALGQKKLELIAEALAPMAQVRTLVRKGMLEELFPGEVLEIRIIDPAIAHLFIGQGEGA